MGAKPNSKTRSLTDGFELKLLGSPAIYWQGEEQDLPSNKAFAMLSYLALRNDAVTRKDISEFLWNTTSTSSVRVALSELRNLPAADDWLETNGQLIKITVQSDVAIIENALKNADYDLALSVWQSSEKDKSFLKNFEVKKADEFMNWLELERSRLNELYLSSLQEYIKYLEENKDYQKALEYSQLLLQQDHLNEDVWRAVIRLEHKQGNTEQALEKFEQLREILKTELRVEPLPETLELLAEIEQASVSAAKAAILISTNEQIPAMPEQLIGRDDLLKSIDKSLAKNKRLLLHGFGGSGKTAVVASYANRFLTKNSGSILWLQAGDDSPESLFDAIAKAFDASQELSQSKDKAKFIKNLVDKKIKLFILDDVWNAYALSILSETIPSGIALIATSRQRYPRFKRIDVGCLNRNDSLELVNLYAGQVSRQKKDLIKDPYLNDLCELLADHAFALRIAGITLALNKLKPKDLIKQIKDNPHTMKVPSEFADQDRESVSALLTVSIQKLSDPAYEALMAFGAMYSSSCTPELLAACIRREEEATEEALIALQKAGLADRQTEAGSDLISYRLHDLVFSFARANSNLRELSVMAACQDFLTKHKQDFDILDAEISNMLGASQSAQKYDDLAFIEFMRLLVEGNAYYQARGHSPKSIELLKAAIVRAKKVGDLEAAHFLVSRLGDMYKELVGDLDLSLKYYSDGLKLAETLGDAHRQAILLCIIGGLRFQQKADDASEYLDRAYILAKNQNDKIALSQILSYKGYVANFQKNYKLSYKFLSEAVKIAQELIDDKSINNREGNKKLFYALLNLGDVEQKLIGFDKALDSRRRALAIAKESDNHLWMGYALQEIAEIYHGLENYELANENYNQALYYYQENNARADFDKLTNFMQENDYVVQLEIAAT